MKRNKTKLVKFLEINEVKEFQEPIINKAKTAMNNAITMLINSAVSILKISLKITIIYAVVYFAADKYFPGPTDGFTSVLPPLVSEITPKNMDSKTLSVMNVFTTCEQVSLINGEIDKDKFKSCFITPNLFPPKGIYI